MAAVKKEWVKLDVVSPGSEATRLEDCLKKNIKGQDSAITDISDAVEIRAAEFQEDDKPIYKALFMGPSGVGKTLVAEILSEFSFGNRRSFTRIACESYSEPHAIAKLIGSPPGYVGFWEPAKGATGAVPILAQESIDKYAILSHDKNKKRLETLKKLEVSLANIESVIFGVTERLYLVDQSEKDKDEDQKSAKVLKSFIATRQQVKNKIDELTQKLLSIKVDRPLSIILFDEIEKASPTLHNILLNILDKAELTLANGNVTRFNNSIIIMTSNANSKAIAELISKKPKMGFRMADSDKRDTNLDAQIYEKSMEAARSYFSPEFLARFDRISVFRPLSPSVLGEIFDLELSKFEDAFLKPLSVILEADAAVKNFILKEATDHPQNGARLLKSKIYKYIKKQLSRLKNRGELAPGTIIHLEMGADGKSIEFYKEYSPPETPQILLLPAK